MKRVFYCNFTGGIEFNTTEKCGGTLLVQHGDQSEHGVCPLNLTKHSKDLLCEQLGCGAAMDGDFNTTLNHTEEVQHPLTVC